MSDDIARRLAALRQHFENFTISGDGIQVQGSIKEGFVISPGPGGGGVRGGLEVLPDYEDACVCSVDNLQGTYYMTTDAFAGTVILDSFGTWTTCFDAIYAGASDEDPANLGFLDFLSPEPTQWQVGLDFGPTPVLYKIAGSGGACDIASPIGHYEGDGYTADVFE